MEIKFTSVGSANAHESDNTGVLLRRIQSEPTLSITDTARLFGIGRATGYAAVKAGEWPTIKVRKRLRIPSAWVLRQLQLTSGSGEVDAR